MFTKQHYETLADQIFKWCAETYDDSHIIEMARFVQSLCELFEADHEAFDANRFRVATSLYDWATVEWDGDPSEVPPRRVVVPTWMREEEQSDWLSDTYGWCHKGFHVSDPRGPRAISYDDLLAAYEGLDVVPSFFETISHEMPDDPTWWVTDNRQDVPIRGEVQFRQPHDSFWGDGKDYQSDVVVDPTWDEIMYLAQDMMKTVGDYHHSFLEGVRVTEVTEEGWQVARFQMGS